MFCADNDRESTSLSGGALLECQSHSLRFKVEIEESWLCRMSPFAIAI
jgi:hypothetical protein